MEDTICAPATPAGMGGVSMVRVSGPQALPTAVKLAGERLSGMGSHTLKLATLRDEEGIIDQGVVSYYAGPKSYTGEDVVEYAVHGSPYIVERLVRALLALGVRMAAPGEFTQRAFLNGRMDLSQAEAVADLISSENKATHDIAMRQLRGGFSSEIEQLRAKLLEFVSLVELELDFGEEDVEFADRAQLRALLAEIASKVDTLRASFRLGNALKEGVPVAIIGKPNAGKSTLINALLHEDRALVSDIPGTTRDTIEEVWHLDGVKFRFIDTAGLRESSDTVERMGIERTLLKMKQARIWLYLFDASSMTLEQARAEVRSWWAEVGLPGEPGGDGCSDAEGSAVPVGASVGAGLGASAVWCVGSGVGEGANFGAGSVPGFGAGSNSPVQVRSKIDRMDVPFVLYVANKCDIIGAEPGMEGEDVVRMSAMRQEGISLLENALRSLIPELPDNGAVILSNARHYEALGLVKADLEKIGQGMDNALPGDLLAMDIRQAIDHLGLITGKIVVDDILGSVFSRFCIGK